jgi:hypothetical protein
MTRQDVALSMGTDDPEQGVKTLNKLMELFPILIADLRK